MKFLGFQDKKISGEAKKASPVSGRETKITHQEYTHKYVIFNDLVILREYIIPIKIN